MALANAPGNGVADDKAVYPFVPEMIRFYLGEEPILAQVPTYVCAARGRPRATCSSTWTSWSSRRSTRRGATACSWGPQSTAAERDGVQRRIQAEPRSYIAQHRVELSTVPDLGRRQAAARAASSRPAPVRPDRPPTASWVLPGGLTRVALREGSYVVNSSQGGGSKDTWVLQDAAPPRRAGPVAVISRVADHCFWLGRYLERTESTARVLQVTGTPRARRRADAASECWQPLIIVVGRGGALRRALRARRASATRRSSSGT